VPLLAKMRLLIQPKEEKFLKTALVHHKDYINPLIFGQDGVKIWDEISI
jgi:hypothetical protein